MPVYYNKNSLANVLLFKQIDALDGVKITLDTSVEKAMLVHMNDKVVKFRECKDGLYYLKMENFNIDNYKNKSTVNHYSHASNNICLVTTVENNKSFFSKKQIKMAELAKKLQQNMGFPGNEAFKKILQNNLIMNSPVTVDDFNRSLQIFGTSEPILKGRMTAPTQVSHRISTSSVPDELKNSHKNIQLFTDLFYVNGSCFLVVKSDIINYLSIVHMVNKKSSTIIKHLNDILKSIEAEISSLQTFLLMGNLTLTGLPHLFFPLHCTYAMQMSTFPKLNEPYVPLRNVLGPYFIRYPMTASQRL